MTEVQFTQGPWAVRVDGLYLRIVHGGHKTTVADGIVSEANARLISAAPELFAPAPNAADLLEQYAEFIRTSVKADDLERHPYLPQIEDTARALRHAIAKATATLPSTGGEG